MGSGRAVTWHCYLPALPPLNNHGRRLLPLPRNCCDPHPQSLAGFVMIHHTASFSCVTDFVCMNTCGSGAALKRASDVFLLLKQGWIPAVGKEGGSQLKVSLCFPGTCNSLRGQNISIIFASFFCLAPCLSMSRTEVGLRLTLGKREGTNVLLNFPHKWLLQEKIQEFRWHYEIFLLTYHSVYTINRKLFGSLKFDFYH